jgi:hypothetical protein
VSSADPLDLPAQLHAREEKVERARLAQRIEISDLKWLMTDKRGRRFIWRLLEQAGVFQSSFSPNNAVMAFNEGKRNYGVWMLAQINAHCPESYIVMAKEAKELELTSARNGDGPKSN